MVAAFEKVPDEISGQMEADEVAGVAAEFSRGVNRGERRHEREHEHERQQLEQLSQPCQLSRPQQHPGLQQWPASADNKQVAAGKERQEFLEGHDPSLPTTKATSAGEISFEARLRAAVAQRRSVRRQNQQHRQHDYDDDDDDAWPAESVAHSKSQVCKSASTPTRTATSASRHHHQQQQQQHQQVEVPTADLKESSSFPVFSRPILAPATSAPVASNGPLYTAARRQRRGSRFEKTSFKLNRLLESSLSMLPQPDLNRMVTVGRSHPSGRHSSSRDRRHRSATFANSKEQQQQQRQQQQQQQQPRNYATSKPRLPVIIVSNQQMPAGGQPAKFNDHQLSHNKQQHLLHPQDSHRDNRKRNKHPQQQDDLSDRTTSRKGSDESDQDIGSSDVEDRDVDGGYAWIILAVVFVINASTFGTARAYGLIFDKLARVDEQTRAEAALPFTIMGAIENMAGPLSGYLLARSSSWRLTVFVGSCLVTLAHLLASLSASFQLGQLLSMGLMCGLGLSFVSISFFQVNNAYFVRYRNTAFGVGMTGAAFGTLYISPLCQYFLNHYEGTGMCYLILGLIVAPNVPLSLLLKPKRNPELSNGSTMSRNASFDSYKSTITNSASEIDQPVDQLIGTEQQSQQQQSQPEQAPANLKTISEQIESQTREGPPSLLVCVKLVVVNPLFHLIWPTQLLFCWFNFVFGMIIVDFGKDRGMNAQDVAHLIPIWAFGQLIGRLVLSTLVDMKLLSYRAFTIICFSAIGITTYILNNTRLKLDEQQDDVINNGILSISTQVTSKQHLIILSLVLVLSMSIALLYILLNGLIVNYVERALQPLSIGISSFVGSFFLLPRAYVIGYYRDTIGNYDAMLTMFTLVSLCAALTWLIVPTAGKYLRKFYEDILRGSSKIPSRNKDIKSILTPYSTWKLATTVRKPEQA